MNSNQSQAALYDKFAGNSTFAQLEQIVQERNNAVTNHKKNDNTNAYSLSKASESLAKMAENGTNVKGKLGAGAPTTGASNPGGSSTPGVGSGNPNVGAGPSQGSQGSSSQSPTYGGSNASQNTPNNWPDLGNGPNDQYDMAMYNYFMQSMSGGMDNPNSIIYFLEALAKMMSSGDAGEQAHLAAFTKALCGATTTDPITGKGSMSYAKAIAMVLTLVDLYDKKSGGSQDFLGQLKSQLAAGGSNPFIAQILSALNNPGDIQKEIQNTYGININNLDKDGLSTLKTILSFATEALAINSTGLDKAGAAYKASYMAMLRQRAIQKEFAKMEGKGANALDMMQFLLGAICGGIDNQISSYQVSIGALSGPGQAIGGLKGDLAPDPTAYDNTTDAQTKAKDIAKWVKQLELYANNPILKKNGIATSINDFLAKLDKISDGKVTLKDIVDGKTTAAQDKTFFQWLMTPQSDGSGEGGSEKMNSVLQDAINDAGIPEQQISSQNDLEKTLFTNANQQASQNLSAAGGVIKDLMKLFSLMVQNQKS
ncbi:MAG: hypothetical protein K940chlam8_00146 [Chlamydiae bacterium]|nr:hypothetical protein [Chlamydiota bacterium]